MYRNNKKGFTLIELLVVIAIIGILSAVVLASLNTARQRGADAAIRSNINNARAQAALYYEEGNTFEGVCAASTGISTMVAAVTDRSSATAVCGGDGATWILAGQLSASSDNAWYCVDHTGDVKELSTAPTAGASGPYGC